MGSRCDGRARRNSQYVDIETCRLVVKAICRVILSVTRVRRIHGRKREMTPHVHISAVHGVAVLAFVIAALGTLHMLALTSDSRPSRALITLGF